MMNLRFTAGQPGEVDAYAQSTNSPINYLDPVESSRHLGLVISGPAVEVPAISVIVPAYNEASRLPETLPRLLDDRFLNPGTTSELIIVDDGSNDGTADVADEILRDYPNAKVVRLPWHAGKGAAVRLGVSCARGEIILFMDADLATDLSITAGLLSELSEVDVAVGSRAAPGAIVKGRSKLRGHMHHAFKRHARHVAGIEVSDPQCGFKAFRADAAKLLFHHVRTNGFGFDVEVLLLARKLGFVVKEVPVNWTAVDGSKVRVMKDPAVMARDIAAARVRNWRRGQPMATLTLGDPT